jgi:S1-C subfamily serine protease
MEETTDRSRFIPVWVAVLLAVIALASGGFLGYSVSGHVLTPATSTVTKTSVTTSFVSQPNLVVNSSGIDTMLLYRNANRSVVTVDGFVATQVVGFFQQGTLLQEVFGSGFVVNQGGSYYVVTNFHVIDSAANITVTFGDGDAYPATVVGKDPYSDLAVLSVQGAPISEFHPLTLYPSSSLQVGEPVVAIGNPFGLSGSMTVGIVSQLGRTINETTAGNFAIADVIQFSAQINPGNSGGPLLDAGGMVVGITTATVSGSQGLGFAIPSDAILREIGPLVTTGSYNNHPYIGIGGVDMNYQLSQVSHSNVTYGVLVESLVSGGPAQKAGLVSGSKQVTIEGQTYLIGGDIITSINGTRIVNYDGLASYMEEHAIPGQIIEVGIVRAGSYRVIPILVGARPSPP